MQDSEDSKHRRDVFPRAVPKEVHTHSLPPPPSQPCAECPGPVLFGEGMHKRGNRATTLCATARCPSPIPAGIVPQLQTDFLGLTLSCSGKPHPPFALENLLPCSEEKFWVVLSLQMAEEGLRRVLFLLGLQMLSQFYIAERGEGSSN